MNIDFDVNAALAKLGELVAKHGPDAVNLAAEVVRVNALNEFIGAAAGLVVVAISYHAAKKTFALAQRKIPDPNYKYIEVFKDQSVWWAITGGLAFLMVVPALVALSTVTNVWNWIALFQPKFALAHQILTKMTGAL